jgi:hypothetical protein
VRAVVPVPERGGAQDPNGRLCVPAYVFNRPFTARHPGIGGANGSAQAERHIPCNIAALSPGTSGRYRWLPATFLPGTVIYADSSAGTTAPQLLYPDDRGGQPARLGAGPE